ncbi:MAG: hypothetical protein NTZ23_05740 [Cyanobium sp. LacPavin_0920_WC12_MAG_63_22]|nr:hypothetical protein [Cyanobium sp. LacPavin_0920_WC12_MAG_63_22]
MKAALSGAVVLFASGLWLTWPWIVPLVSPVPTSGAGSDLVVVLDGGLGRFAAANRIGHALPQRPQRLLIRCPIGTPPPQPTPELLQGFDTATQITALAHWLHHQPSPRSARVWIATDPDHTARAVVLARIALGSQGIRVGPTDLPTPSPSEHRKLLRDSLRLTLWRATGSTGARLAPEVVARKRADCGV